MSTPARFAAIVLTSAAFVVAGAFPALADDPTTWVEVKGRTIFQNVVFFGGWTIGLYILVVLLGLLTARKNYVAPVAENLPDTHPHH